MSSYWKMSLWRCLLGNHLVTHLLVSSNWWIFLCSSRLLALHADILQKDREESRQREWEYTCRWSWTRTASNNTVLGHCIVSPLFLSLPISVCWVLSRTPFCPSNVPAPPLLYFVFHFSHNESPSIMALWLSQIIIETDALLISSSYIWFNYQQMLTPPSTAWGNRPQAWMRGAHCLIFKGSIQ